jgi:hypothetical protein
MYSTAQSYLDMPLPSAPPQPPCAHVYDAATQWVVPVYSTKIDTMTVSGAFRYLNQANAKLGGDQTTFVYNSKSVVHNKNLYDPEKKAYLRDIEKMLFELCIAVYAQCRKTPDTNAVFARGNLVEMAQLCKDLK